MTTGIGIGDVMAVRSSGIGGWAVRFGAWIRGLPHGVNHVVIAHHQNPDGTWIGLEGRPGGVGWVDMTNYLASPATVDNREQPKTEAQRYLIAKGAEVMLRTPYDWAAIIADAGYDVGLPLPEALDWCPGQKPLHVVCSSYACWEYDQVALARPEPAEGGRFEQPANWCAWIRRRGWVS